MADDVADARWSHPRYFYGQPSFELTSVGRRSSGWELLAATLVGSLIPVVDLVGFLALLLASSVGFRFSLLMEFPDMDMQ
jgi:hypothetical protein